MKDKHIYLDYAATTPMHPEVREEMMKYMSSDGDLFGNPSSLHHFGQIAHATLEDSRTTIAKMLAAHYSEIVFFSCATEANNFVLQGVTRKYVQNEKKKPHIIISSLEHASVRETAQRMEARGDAELSIVRADSNGVVSAKDVLAAVRENTALVSVMYVQNETGIVQPIEEIANEVRLLRGQKGGMYPLFHTDAAQAFLLELNTKKNGVDMLTLSSHKMYGPKGSALLYIRGDEFDTKDICDPMLYGGGQEKGLRSGTENLPAIAGLAKASELLEKNRKRYEAHIREVSEYFIQKLNEKVPEAHVQGQGVKRSPHIVHVRFPGNEHMAVGLDMAGISVSSGSACAQRTPKMSFALASMGNDEKMIRESVRFSFEINSTKKEIDEVIDAIIMVYRQPKIG